MTTGWTNCGHLGGTATTWRTVLEPVIDHDTDEQMIDADGELVWMKIKVVDDIGTPGPDQYRPGMVLDPFAGTGTTLVVADIHGRDATGFDIDQRNPDMLLARTRECLRALRGAPMPRQELPGQIDLFGAAS